MPIEVRPIDPRNRRRKKMGRMGPSKPTRMGKIEERPWVTQMAVCAEVWAQLSKAESLGELHNANRSKTN